jgi:ADP-ribose pyrophosphatase
MERKMKEIEQLDSQTVYQNRWMRVREDKVRRQSGDEGLFGVVEKPDFVVIIPIEKGYIHIVEQYRYPVQTRFWELPQGSWEGNSEADHKLVAAGELREETGLISDNMTYLGWQYLAYGYSSQAYHIYLATELKFTSNNLDAEEQGLITKKIRMIDFEEMIRSGEIKDATTVNAYGLAKLKGLI